MTSISGFKHVDDDADHLRVLPAARKPSGPEGNEERRGDHSAASGLDHASAGTPTGSMHDGARCVKKNISEVAMLI